MENFTKHKKGIIFKAMAETIRIRERFDNLKPAQVIWPLLIILILAGVVVGIINYQKNVTANKVPTVTINNPKDNTTVTDSSIVISGTVDKGDKVTVNDKKVTVDPDGNFSYTAPLSGGANNVTIVATGKNGKSAITTRKITREIPTPIVSVPASSAPVSGATVSGNLTSSGPEDLWFPEAGLLSAAVVAWSMTKGKLNKALRKQS